MACTRRAVERNDCEVHRWIVCQRQPASGLCLVMSLLSCHCMLLSPGQIRIQPPTLLCFLEYLSLASQDIMNRAFYQDDYVTSLPTCSLLLFTLLQNISAPQSYSDLDVKLQVRCLANVPTCTRTWDCQREILQFRCCHRGDKLKNAGRDRR
ncbi:hypothetical protein ARMGADRAFT_301635 [Armillaria gallica]|uniref:Uncharacterized protein n=1 Tax=Armillaria gallica TaxID=47427 RepID=A0A2H3DP14_ARMGA|nr:hypothetical protein ARMGADRAFT_301635 [Armillaria gallica]